MNPIFRGGFGEGIGYSMNQFDERFREICKEHLDAGRARAFALIFYGFNDIEFIQLLENRGAFTKLDRLSGSNLTVFFLDSEAEEVVKYFNNHFLGKLGLVGDAQLPCIVFFKIRDGQTQDVKLTPLESTESVLGFHELYTAIENYIKVHLVH